MSSNIIIPVKRCAILYATRDLAAASGDISYTGIGFKPRKILVISLTDTVHAFLPGYYDDTPRYACMYTDRTNWFTVTDRLLDLYDAAGAHQSVIVKTLDENGFTLTWTKTGSPTALTYLIFSCYE